MKRIEYEEKRKEKFIKIVTRGDKEKTEARKMSENRIVLKSESGRVCAIINLKYESESESESRRGQ